MSQDAQERTEEASSRQLRDARRRGEVAKSDDLTSAVLLAAALAIIVMQSGAIAGSLLAEMKTCFEHAVSGAYTPTRMLAQLGDSTAAVFAKVIPVWGVLMGVAILATFLQVGSLLTLEPLLPKMDRLNPVSGLKNKLFKLRPYIQLLKNILKIMAVAVICWITIADSIWDLVHLPASAPMAFVQLTGFILLRCVVRVILFFAAVAILDVFYQRWQYKRDQRVSKDQKKRDAKESEGDPHVKQARKRLHREVADNNMLQQVRNADVVITNPTQIACALRYDPEEDGVPRLLGKGDDALAARIREVAKEEGIPIKRNVPLARALNQLDVDALIPNDLFDAVILVLQWVEQVAESKGKKPRWRRVGASQ